MSPLRTIITCFVLIVPLIAGAAYLALTDADISETWQQHAAPAAENATDNLGGPAAAPTPGGTIAPEQLIGVRRAAGEANSQAGFLVAGTGELVAGVEKLNTSAGEVGGATQQLTDGSQQLTDGLIQIQAGTGELGNAATQVADGVDQAAEQIQSIIALQPQLLAALDEADKKLAGNPLPDAVEARKQIAGFKTQVETFQLDAATVDQLAQLRSGSREVANQLTQPGARYHDGIYQATDGSKQLTSKLREYSTGIDTALASVGELNTGAQRINGMANATKDKTTAVQRSLPAVTPVTDAQTGNEEAKTPASLPPMYAYLISALIITAGLIIGAGYGLGSGFNWRRASIATALLGALGTVLFALLGIGINAGNILLTLGVNLLAAAVAVLGGRAVRLLLGARIGAMVLILAGLAQIAAVGWVWKTTASAETAIWAQTISALMPLHYPTAALSTIGNEGSVGALIVACGVLGLLAVGGGVVARRG